MRRTLLRSIDSRFPVTAMRARLARIMWQRDPIGTFMAGRVALGQSVVDIGANRGLYTLLLSRLVGKGGVVHALEPYPPNVQRLTRIAEAMRNIEVHAVAASDTPGTQVLSVPVVEGQVLDALGTLRSDPPSSGAESLAIATNTLDAAIPEGDRPVSLIKCDVEGHEDAVFRGASSILVRDRPTIVVEVEQRHRDAPISDAFALFMSGGYAGFFFQGARLRPLSDFNAHSMQEVYECQSDRAGRMPSQYVHDFVFLPTP